jgi:hypothetical protein
MAPPPPPRFESLANAFNATPTVKRKRQPTEPTSPVTTPKKQRMAAVVVSPAESPRSQGRSQSQRSQASVEEMYVDVDWQPDLNAEVEAELEVAPPPPRDERAEVSYLVPHIN